MVLVMAMVEVIIEEIEEKEKIEKCICVHWFVFHAEKKGSAPLLQGLVCQQQRGLKEVLGHTLSLPVPVSWVQLEGSTVPSQSNMLKIISSCVRNFNK